MARTLLDWSCERHQVERLTLQSDHEKKEKIEAVRITRFPPPITQGEFESYGVSVLRRLASGQSTFRSRAIASARAGPGYA